MKNHSVFTTWAIMIAHSPTYRTSQPIHQQKSLSYFLIPPSLFLPFIFVLLPGKFPIFSFSFLLFLCAFHLYLTTLTLQNLFYPRLHGRRGKRKRKKDNERKKPSIGTLISFLFCKLAFVELPGAAPVSPNAARVLFIRRGLKSN